MKEEQRGKKERQERKYDLLGYFQAAERTN